MAIAGLRQVVGCKLEVGREPFAERMQGRTRVHLQQQGMGRSGLHARRAVQVLQGANGAWSNSNSAMLEVYEAHAWQAGDSILDPTLSVPQQRTLSQWNERLHARRRRNFPALGDPTPTTISFTFTRSIDPYETFYYFVPRSGPRSSWPASLLLGYINLLY